MGEADLMVPVGEGIGETNGEGDVYWESILTGRAGLCMGGGGPRSSSRDVKAILIWVEGNRMIHLEGERGERETERQRGEMRGDPTLRCELLWIICIIMIKLRCSAQNDKQLELKIAANDQK